MPRQLRLIVSNARTGLLQKSAFMVLPGEAPFTRICSKLEKLSVAPIYDRPGIIAGSRKEESARQPPLYC